ncbi:multisubunit sodium/proton antiporter MrpE subunit [Microcella putealis]|uniref:Multisubunit sodium/proton antiporter MrpE subunit n=1 Tax=Microcella putealis TaxID=337005 RepID=A0A4Q7LRH6_9MICO|nr:Na+/H+ antiporter subunit E [Microcella putealis]RZS57466.1 multisubunit sodium/proton antiporter MrpE subunit [Microcella putealis]TQM24533.1 multisubunit sodium/proton antiporter MrpE subunit [Microcella putealis]
MSDTTPPVDDRDRVLTPASAPEPPAEPRRRITFLQLSPLLIALVIFWMLLWGSTTPLTILTGIVLAVLVTRVLYLPRVVLAPRVNPWWFIMFLAVFFGQLVTASFQVAFQAVFARRIQKNAVITAQLHTRSDFILTSTAIAISLVPGSVVLEIDREHAILYVHVLGADSPEKIDRARATIIETERRLLRALGSRDEWEAVR